MSGSQSEVQGQREVPKSSGFIYNQCWKKSYANNKIHEIWTFLHYKVQQILKTLNIKIAKLRK